MVTPIFLKVPYKQLSICCISWKFEAKINGGLVIFTKKPDLPLKRLQLFAAYDSDMIF